MKRKLLNILVLLLLCQAYPLFAQKYISPYSRFGIGDMASDRLIRHRAIGASIALGGENRISLNNPATWGHLSSYNLESGISTNFYRLRTDAQDYRNYDFHPAYLSLAVPLRRDSRNIWGDTPATRHNWGLSAGLMPYSRVSYQTRVTRTDTPALGANELNIGEGGLSKFYIGTAYELFNHFFVGISGSYIFGQNRYRHDLVFNDTDSRVSLYQTNSYVVGGITVDAGLFGAMHVGKRHKNIEHVPLNDTFRFGLTFTPPMRVGVRQDREAYTMILGSEDSLISETRTKGQMHLPMAAGAGLSYTFNNRHTLAFDAIYRQWSRFSLIGENPGLDDQLLFSLGSEWMFGPDTADGSAKISYGRIMKFRAGIKYGLMHYPDEQVTDMGFSAGVSLPVRTFPKATESQFSYVDITFEAGRTGKPGINTAQRDYLMISLGLHLFDNRWFYRPRIE